MSVDGFGREASGPIFLDQIHCDGGEEGLSSCTSTDVHMCTHEDDVGIVCHRKNTSFFTVQSVSYQYIDYCNSKIIIQRIVTFRCYQQYFSMIVWWKVNSTLP